MHLSAPLAIVSSLASFFAFATAQDMPISLFPEPYYDGQPMDIEADSACITLPNQLRRHLGSIETRGPIVCTLYRSGDCSQDSTLRDIYDGDDNLFASGVGRNAESVRCQFRS